MGTQILANMDLESLLERFRRGDRLALSRLLSLLARGERVPELLAGLPSPPKPSRVVALTGSGGVGKSTLAGKLIEHLRRQRLTIAVLACDPQSPLSGGALLGDRFRMAAGPDDGLFIRSLATPAGREALAPNLGPMVRLLEAFGFDVVLVETVGAGQGDTAVRGLADVVVLMLQPQTGDDWQWEKAGLLEVADVVVIHKADLPGADAVETQVRAAVGSSAGAPATVLRVSARSGEGVEALWQAIAACPLRRPAGEADGADLLRAAQQALADWFAEARGRPAFQELLSRWRQGQLSRAEAVSGLLRLLDETNP